MLAYSGRRSIFWHFRQRVRIRVGKPKSRAGSITGTVYELFVPDKAAHSPRRIADTVNLVLPRILEALPFNSFGSLYQWLFFDTHIKGRGTRRARSGNCALSTLIYQTQIQPSLHLAMTFFKSLLAVTVALIATASAAPRLESRQTVAPLGWDYIGCWNDNPARRTLMQESLTNTTAMTVEMCVAFCSNGNFNLAGVEFGQECWCSNAMDNGPSPIASATCSQACVGNVLEKCGGPQAINVYRQSI
ncbi:hypothetical protein D9619_009960 [Psilocybe cf. subviscida]|uniref:WSC domain-containing protein n=1 Tax=Psilocybe cf. subviscida TaxID=2480587 RepID=A0A8H5BKY6_9AGAR|nr:hypothetical protein D9619_009960 [Psilocybe cf. subviscida]